MKIVLGFCLIFLFSFSAMADEPAERPGTAPKPPSLEPPEPVKPEFAPVEMVPFEENLNPPEEYRGPGDPNHHEYYPKFMLAPTFPPKATKECQEGMALLNFTITTEGNVEDIVVVEEDPFGFGFADASIAVARKLKYYPRVVHGKRMEVNNVPYKFIFEFADPCKK